MNAQVGDFCVSRGPPTVPLMQISRSAVFLKSQNLRNAGTLCISFCLLVREFLLFANIFVRTQTESDCDQFELGPI